MAIEQVRMSYETVKWDVAEGESYKLRLRTKDICEIERQIGGKNLLTMISDISNGIPPLDTMLTVAHAAMRAFNHGINKDKVYDLFDKYISNGGSQIDFLVNVYINIFVVSGFFTPDQAEAMKEALAGINVDETEETEEIAE